MILAINTSSIQFSIALTTESGALAGEYTLSVGGAGARPLFHGLHELLVRTESDLKSIRAMAVARGPGSFTGLRVGLSAAKGFCQALGIPIIGVSSLEALASQWNDPGLPVCPLLGSRKGEVFAALFRAGEGGSLVRIKEDRSLRIEELTDFVEDKTVFLGDDYDGQAEEIREVLAGRALLAPPPTWAPRASAVAMMAVRRLQEGDFDDPGGLVPTYLRAPDIRPRPISV